MQLYNIGSQPIVLVGLSVISFPSPTAEVRMGPSLRHALWKMPNGTMERGDISKPGLDAAFANGVTLGHSGLTQGLHPDAPPEDAATLSQHGILLVQVSNSGIPLAQSMHAQANGAWITAFAGMSIPPGRGFTVRSHQLDAPLACSFVWDEPST